MHRFNRLSGLPWSALIGATVFLVMIYVTPLLVMRVCINLGWHA